MILQVYDCDNTVGHVFTFNYFSLFAGAVHHTFKEATDYEIQVVISEWLRHAGDRLRYTEKNFGKK